MASFDMAVEYVLKKEKGLEENPSDPGGITNMGISLRMLRSLDPYILSKYGLHDPIDSQTVRSLTPDQAKAIYRGEFWDHARFQDIISQSIATYLFDAAVNMGISPAIKCIQRAVWAVLHNKEVMIDDGILGDETLKIINTCSPYLLFPALVSERGGEYRLISAMNPGESSFLPGWLSRAYNA